MSRWYDKFAGGGSGDNVMSSVLSDLETLQNIYLHAIRGGNPTDADIQKATTDINQLFRTTSNTIQNEVTRTGEVIDKLIEYSPCVDIGGYDTIKSGISTYIRSGTNISKLTELFDKKMKCVENTGLATEIQKLKETIRTNEAALNAALEQLENVKRTTQIQVESAKTTAADSVQREKILMDELKRLSNADANTQKQLVIDYFVKFISDMLTNIGGLVGRNISISPKTKLNELKNHEQELLAIIKDMTTKLPGYSTRVTTASARLAKIILDLESDLTAAKSVKNPDESRYGLTEISEKIKKIKEDEKVALGEFSNSDKKAALARIEQAVIRELGIKK